MVEQKDLKKDFAFLKNKVLGILVYGSYATEKATPRSDIDICVVLGKGKDISKRLKEIWEKVNVNKKNYDVKTFEELPLHIQIEIIKKNKIVYTKDKPELYEYFYFYRKLWKDQEHRQMISKKELVESL